MPTHCPRCQVVLAASTAAEGLCAACLLAGLFGDDDDDLPLTSATLTTAGELQSGSMLGSFRIVGLLGKGGMAAVYEAYDARLDRPVALKILPAALLHDETFAQRFAREARLVAGLVHPNIVTVHASGIDGGIPWMSMRLLEGGSLADLLRRGRLDVRRIAEILSEVAAALDHAHEAGVVHRDIKPANILLDGAGHACVGDFGLARVGASDRAMSRVGVVTGTPEYMAPEQASGLAIDRRTDVYGLGMLAYEMLTGHPAFAGPTSLAVLMQQVQEPVPIPPSTEVPERMFRVVGRAVSKNPDDRWASAGEFAVAFMATTTERPPTWFGVSRRRQIPVLVAVVGVLVSGVMLATRTSHGPPVTGGSADAVLPSARTNDAPLPGRAAVGTARPGTAVRPTQAPAPRGGITPPASAGRPVPTAAPGRPDDGATLPAAPPGVAATAISGTASADTPPPAVAAEPVTLPSSPGAAPEAPAGPRLVPATRLTSVEPVYPPVARAAELQGQVLLAAWVGADGRVASVDVVRSVHPLLDAAARAAVLQYIYAPATRDGVPEPTRVQIAITFALR